MTTQMIIRIDPDLKNKVSNFAKIEGKSASEVVRELIEAYVRDRDITSYIDNLWGRMGDKLASSGFGAEDVDRIIRDVRSGK